MGGGGREQGTYKAPTMNIEIRAIFRPRLNFRLHRIVIGRIKSAMSVTVFSALVDTSVPFELMKHWPVAGGFNDILYCCQK